jgi:hypothetical protein
MDLMDMKVESGVTDGWRSPVYLTLTKSMNISAFFVVPHYGIFHRHGYHHCPNAKHHSCLVQLILLNLVPL